MIMDEMRQREIGQRLRYLRRQRALTLRQLAVKLEVKYQTISRWEIGNMPIGGDTLRRVANFFNVRPEWLESGEGSSQPEPGVTTWPASDLRRVWGIDLPALPSEWPESFAQFVANAVAFGMFPSVGGLTNMLDRATDLGTNAPLPQELELAVKLGHGADPRKDQTLVDRYLVAIDAALDALESASRKLRKD